MRIRSILVTTAALVLAAPSLAFGQVSFGPELSFGGDTDLGIGGRILANISSVENLDFMGTFDVWFPDSDGADVSAWEANGNAAYNFRIEDSSLSPYAGAGLNIFHVSVDDDDSPGDGFDETDLGLNLFGGLKFPGTSVTPFAEVRAVLEGADQIVVTGGVLF